MIETIALYGLTPSEMRDLAGYAAFVGIALAALPLCHRIDKWLTPDPVPMTPRAVYVVWKDAARDPAEHAPDSPADVRRVDPVPADVNHFTHRPSSKQMEQRNHG